MASLATGALLVAAASAAPVRLSRIFGLFPKEESIQDFWGPVRLAFEATFDYEASYQAESDDEVGEALDAILAAVGDEPEAAVVVGPHRHGAAHYASFLEAGGAAFFLAEAIDTAAYGITNETALAWMFNPDTTTAAQVVAKEICRTTSGAAFRHKVLKLYGAPYADNRDLAEAYAFAALVKDSSITTILAANDRMIKGALKAIDRALSPAKAANLIIGGFDWTEDWLLTKQLQVASGDQYMSTAGTGVWQSVVNFIDTVQGFKLNTTADVQAFFRTDDTRFDTEASCQFADAEGFVIDDLLSGYQPGVRAKPEADKDVAPTVVAVGLHDVAVEGIDTAGGGFTATSWMTLEWADPRLAFDANIYAGSLRTIKLLPATISPDGTVRVVFQAVGDFVCDMNIKPYPYDAHDCSFDVAVSAPLTDVVLMGSLGFTIADGPEGFVDPEASGIDHYYEDATIKGFASSRVSFEIKFERDPSYVVGTYVLVGWAFNMVGFLVFWIPVEGSGIDRSGLAITTILAAQFMMYDAKVTSETTWLDYYFAIMLCFQFFSFVLTVHSARMNRYTMSHGGDDEYVIKVFAYQDRIQRKSMAHRLGFFIFNFVYGGLDAFWIDRWARRRVEINRRFGTAAAPAPCFYAVQMAICFFPRQGPADISGSDHTGVRAQLFRLNLAFFVFYAVVLVAALCLGFVHDRRMDNLRQRHRAEVETELILENIKMHFDGNIVAMNLFSDVGKLRRNFERWKRTVLASSGRKPVGIPEEAHRRREEGLVSGPAGGPSDRSPESEASARFREGSPPDATFEEVRFGFCGK
ncbi:GABA-A receptor [Aureococcus anophagefferens]|nr:GABA-A receptor [Aureococcus anophagefferens]